MEQFSSWIRIVKSRLTPPPPPASPDIKRQKHAHKPSATRERERAQSFDGLECYQGHKPLGL